MRRLPIGIKIWLAALFGCVLAVAISFPDIDVAVARYFAPDSHHLHALEKGFGSAVLLSVQAAIILGLVLVRWLRGQISPFGKALGLACATSICAYAVNASILKVGFGVPNPRHVLHGAHHAFHWLSGSKESSFPSGHMVLAAAFAGVFMRLYRASVLPLSILLAVAASLLLVGDWHFLSDLIAGTFVGISAGLITAEVWTARSN